MGKVYLSFLGIGQKQDTRKNGKAEFAYTPTVYRLKDATSAPTPFVQAAELEILGGAMFDRVVIVDTEKSHQTNFSELVAALRRHGARTVQAVTIREEMTPEGQWEWFEAFLDCIEPHDQLTVDLTHGFRAIPIIFSAAIHFLQKSRSIRLEAVYYGVFEKVKELGHAPIIDMKDFFIINEWAEAVGRLVEDADARKLARVAVTAPGFQFGELGDPAVISALHHLTDTIRNVDADRVAPAAEGALTAVRRKERQASTTSRMLLNLIIEKYASLASAAPATGRYDRPYFQLQLALSRLLLEHRLFMQAYTAMRELIASLAMVFFEREGLSNAKRKNRRKVHAELFLTLFQYNQEKWIYNRTGKDGEYLVTADKRAVFEKVKPFYDALQRLGIEAKLRRITVELAKYRNGFDHAWIMAAEETPDIENRGWLFLAQLEEVIADFQKAGLMD